MREKTLEEKQLELAKVVSILNEQISRKEHIISQREQTKLYLEKIFSQGEVLDISDVNSYKGFFSKLLNDERIQNEIIANTQIALKHKQKQVNEALKEVKIFEKLKENQEKKFYQHIEYVQAQEIDDIASTRYLRMQAAR